MTAAQPPRLATWLLHRFLSGPRRESLTGDLIERYQQRRSPVWYWRQVITAVVLSAVRDIATHKALAARAVAIGYLASALLSVPKHWLGEMTRASVFDWLAASGHYSFWPVFLAGPLVFTLFEVIAGVAIGCIVARLPPSYAAAMVSLVSTSVLVFEVGLVAVLLATQPHAPMPLPAMMLPLVLATGKPLGVLLGGLWIARPAERSLSAI